jgi:hypothetical protein
MFTGRWREAIQSGKSAYCPAQLPLNRASAFDDADSVSTRIQDIFFRRNVPEQIALALHRPDAARGMSPRSMRIILLLTAVGILNVIDLVYTLYAHSIGELREMNPLADMVLQAGRFPLVCFKVMMILIGFSLLWKCRRSKWTVPACWLLLGAFTALGIIWCVWVGKVTSTADMQIALGMH